MSLVAWYPLISDFHNQGIDNIATVTGTSTSFVTGGKIGNCCKLGYSSNFTIPSLVNAKQISIAYWLKVNTATSTQWLDPVHYFTNSGSGDWTTRQELYSNCTLTGFWFDNGSIVGIPITVGQWVHFAITVDYEAGVAKVYKDGALVGTSTAVNTSTKITGTNFRFGESGLDLCENDLRIYNHILSQKEVAEIAKGLVLHYPMTGGDRGGTNLVADSYVNTTSSNYGFGVRYVDITEGQTYTVSARGYVSDAAVSSGTKLAVYFYKSDWSYAPAILSITDTSPTTKFATFTATQTTALRITSYSFKGQGTAGDPVTAIWYKVEEGDKATPWMPNSTDTEYNAMGYNDNIEYDVSGYLHNGTRVGTFSWSSDTPRYSVSTVFANANSNYISLGSKTFDMTSVTFSAWFKIKTAKTWSRIFDFGASEGAGYCIGLATGSNGTTLTVWGRLGSAGSSLPDKQIQTISLNTWYHAVITISGTTCSCYVNGQLVVSFSINSAFPSATTFNYIYFGKSVFSADKYLDGNISDFRMYATALSAEDIQKLYNTSASLANNGTLMAYEFTEM